MKNKMKLIATIICTIFVFTGCTSEKPSDVVESYFNEIKTGINSQVKEVFTDSINQEEGNESEESEAINEAINIYMSKIDTKILSEKIDGDNASVEVELSGLNLGNIMIEVLEENLSKMFEVDNNMSENIDKDFLEKTKSAEVETRTGTINLTKVDGNWEIKEDQDSISLIFGSIK